MNLPKTLLRLFLGRRLPITDGALTLPGPLGEIRIRRDSYGVPYIDAQTENDAWFGLGFCHAQDRAFQLESILRIVRGSLAESFGEKLLPVDRLARRIGFRRAGEAQLAVLPAGQRAFLDAYAGGVNAGFVHGVRRPAHEFSLLRAAPTPWEAADLLGYMNYMGMGLSGWTSKLTRFAVLLEDGPEALAALDSDYPDWLFVTDPVGAAAGPSVQRLLADAQALDDFLGAGASNNWALDGSRTASGKPILANDPHLAARLPAPWYLAHLRSPGLSVCGASFAGLPLIASGFNGTAAWGVTAGLVDGIDLYIEDLDPAARTVRSGDGVQACRVLRERFAIKGRPEPFEEDILITPRGPVISDMLEGFAQTISMKATWMNPRPLEGLSDFHKATDFLTCRRNFKHLYLVSLNVVYADTSGMIGWQLIGEAPRRKKGSGLLPLPGWDPDCDWGDEHVLSEEMPWSMNPPDGLIATANNQPRRDGDGPYLGRDFVPYRHARILEMLAERRDWDLDRSRAMQLDQFAIPWREMRADVLSAAVEGGEARAAQALLAGWDGVLGADSAAAAVYEGLLTAMARRLAELKAPRSSARVLGKGFSAMFPASSFLIRHSSQLVRLLRERPEGWFGEGWDAAVSAGLRDAWQTLVEGQGPDSSRWSWGRAHPLILAHQIGARKPFDRVFNRGPYPAGGDGDTVSAAGRRTGQYGSPVTFMAGLRMAVEVGDWEKNAFILAGGQSGNPLSSQYDDQLGLWLQGEAISIAWSEAAIAARTMSTLVLKAQGTSTT